MEIISHVQYLTAIQGALRFLVALTALVLLILTSNSRSHLPAFKYFSHFLVVMGIWGLVSGTFFLYPGKNLLPYISSLIYASITFGGPTFFLFGITYAMPHRLRDIKKLKKILLIPSIIFAIFALVPPLQRFFITFTPLIVYIPYRDIGEQYHFLYYISLVYGIITVLMGIILLFQRGIRHSSSNTRGNRLACVSAIIYIGQAIVSAFVTRHSHFFWIPSVSVIICMVLFFFTLYYDSAEQIMFKGQSKLLETVPFPVFILNQDNIVLYSNNIGKDIYNTIKKTQHTVVNRQQMLQNFVFYEIDQEVQEQGILSQQFIQKKDDGTIFFLQEQNISDEENRKIQGRMMMLVPLTFMQQFFTSLEEKAFRDSLCGCYNRHALELHQKEFLSEKHFPLSLLMCDMDNLKKINDILGHKRGDEYIITCLNTIRSYIRNNAPVFRLGGDEFLVILPRTPQTVAQSIAEKIEEEIQKHNRFNSIPTGISIGLATITSVDMSFSEGLQIADEAMYKNKLSHKETYSGS